jgi:hypothetical protein
MTLCELIHKDVIDKGGSIEYRDDCKICKKICVLKKEKSLSG